jgi:hypothetical protein
VGVNEVLNISKELGFCYQYSAISSSLCCSCNEYYYLIMNSEILVIGDIINNINFYNAYNNIIVSRIDLLIETKHIVRNNHVFLYNHNYHVISLSCSKFLRNLYFSLSCHDALFNKTSSMLIGLLANMEFIRNIIYSRDIVMFLRKRLSSFDNVFFTYKDLKLSFNCGIRGSKRNSINGTLIRIDFKSFFSSIYLYYEKIFFLDINCKLVKTLNYIFALRETSNSSNVYYKKFLNYFYGANWSVNCFGITVATMGEIIMFSFIYYIGDYVDIIDCNVDHITVILKYDDLVLDDLLSKFIKLCGLSFLRFGVTSSSSRFWKLRDYNNSVMLVGDEIVGRGIYDYSTAIQRHDENTFNSVIKIFISLDKNLFDLPNKLLFYFSNCDDKIVLKNFLNETVRVVNVHSDIVYDDVNTIASYKKFLSICHYDILISVIDCMLKLHSLYLYPVILKKQPQVYITNIVKLLSISNYYSVYWTNFVSLHMSEIYSKDISLAVFCDNIIVFDFDDLNVSEEYLNIAVKINCIVSISPSKRVKILVRGMKYMRSVFPGLEIISNRWVNIYGRYSGNTIKTGYYSTIFPSSICHIDDLLNSCSFFKNLVTFKERSYAPVYGLGNNSNKVRFNEIRNYIYVNLNKYLNNVKSIIHYQTYYVDSSERFSVKMDIKCGGHNNRNHQAYCYLECINSNGYVSVVKFNIRCSGSNCKIDYWSMRINLMKELC